MVYNFSAGPSMLPKEVMREAQEEFLDYKNCGMSVAELNHRSMLFNDIVTEAKERLRRLLRIPDNYKIIFMQGGAALQFSAVPMNIMKMGKAGFVITGHWAKRAYEEAGLHGEAIELASSEKGGFTYIPKFEIKETDSYDYIHICQNNTIYGTEYKDVPDVGKNDLVADMSSCILSEPVDIRKYALIYAGAQKNIGIAGTTLVIIREDLVTEKVKEYTPFVMRYKNQSDSDSRYNTPSCYSIYMCGKVLKWLDDLGGLSVVREINKKKAKLIYDFIDESKLFHGMVNRGHRSTMNVTFSTGNSGLDMEIVEDSKKYGFVSIKGHRFVGGLRASLYNAIPYGHVRALVDYLKEFERCH